MKLLKCFGSCVLVFLMPLIMVQVVYLLALSISHQSEAVLLERCRAISWQSTDYFAMARFGAVFVS